MDTAHLSRRAALGLAAGAFASCLVPARGFAQAAASEAVARHAAAARSNVVALRDGELFAEAGAIARKLPAYSVRKSLLSALYGWAVEAGKIRLEASLAELGIDDVPPALTADEKRATVRDLLMARSGVYHPAAHETRQMRESRPARGSHPRGTYWFYNNWDFNALGTIYEQATGERIFASFERRIARPIGMLDFVAADGLSVREPSSQHAAYTFRLTARDLARFGELMRRGGMWGAERIIPAAWIAESTQRHSQTDRRDRGYGYMWWTFEAGRGVAGFLASGNGGQLLAVVPTARLVLAQLRPRNNAERATAPFLQLARELAGSE